MNPESRNRLSRPIQTMAAAAAAILIVRVTVEVVYGYRNYLPPNFSSEFLAGRNSYFYGTYQWAFYPHIASGPVVLFLGLPLLSDRFRTRFPQWHRWLGRVQLSCVLFVVAPSGLWMAFYTATGTIAGVGFVLLSLSTALSAAQGWRLARARRFAEHRIWMWRCYLLLCSAVLLRVFGGLGSILSVQSPWYDPVASWTSWLLPITTYEVIRRWKFGMKAGK